MGVRSAIARRVGFVACATAAASFALSGTAIADNRQTTSQQYYWSGCEGPGGPACVFEVCAYSQASIDLNDTSHVYWSKVIVRSDGGLGLGCFVDNNVDPTQLKAKSLLYLSGHSGPDICVDTSWVANTSAVFSWEVYIDPPVGSLCGTGLFYYDHAQQDFIDPSFPPTDPAGDHYGSIDTPDYLLPK